MPRRDWFTDAFGAAVTDVRNKLIEEAWFGRHPAQTMPIGSLDDGWDRVLSEKLYPDRIADKAHLSSLEAEHVRDAHRPDPSPSHEHDLER